MRPLIGLFPSRRALWIGPVAALAVIALALPSWAQQPDPPDPPASSLSWQARIAPAGEPGEPLVISGQVLDPSGLHAVPNIVVYAYHTDIKGLYTPSGARPPRLRGWARTDAEGRYEFRTIRPAPYPGDGPPAHVHFYLSGPGYPRQEAEELQFEGDPKVTPDMAERARRAGRFGGVRPLTRGTDGVWHCRFDLRLRPSSDARFKATGAFFALSVADLPASAKWYSEKLGLKVVMEEPKRAGSAVTVLEGGGLVVELIQDDDALPLSKATPASTRRESVHGMFKAGALVEDFEGTVAMLTARAVEIAYGPYPARDNQRANVIIRDNSGNLIQFLGRYEDATPAS
jgi:protocatechuate 3,4-dioxygenase, beta subunit